jgi:hypothetical protein
LFSRGDYKNGAFKDGVGEFKDKYGTMFAGKFKDSKGIVVYKKEFG